MGVSGGDGGGIRVPTRRFCRSGWGKNKCPTRKTSCKPTGKRDAHSRGWERFLINVCHRSSVHQPKRHHKLRFPLAGNHWLRSEGHERLLSDPHIHPVTLCVRFDNAFAGPREIAGRVGYLLDPVGGMPARLGWASTVDGRSITKDIDHVSLRLYFMLPKLAPTRTTEEPPVTRRPLVSAEV